MRIQELHEARGTYFYFPSGTERIPEWFEQQGNRPSISFWFRAYLPSAALLFLTKLKHGADTSDCLAEIKMFINGYKFNELELFIRPKIQSGHAYLFDMNLHSWLYDGFSGENKNENIWSMKFILEEALSTNEWNHAVVTCTHEMKDLLRIESGIHIYKEKNSTENIRFSNPYKKSRFVDA